MKHSAGNVISGQRYNIVRDNIQRAMSSGDKCSNNVIPLSTDETFSGNVISGQRYNISRENIQRAMSSVDKGITLLEITFSGQCHLWTKALIMLYLCPLMKHSAGNVISGQRYDIIRGNIQRQCHQWTKV